MSDIRGTGGSVTFTNGPAIDVVSFALTIEQDIVNIPPTLTTYSGTNIPVMGHVGGAVRMSGSCFGNIIDTGIPIGNTSWANFTASAAFALNTSRSITADLVLTGDSMNRRLADGDVTVNFRNKDSITIA